ncbi:MAG: aminotransferase class IV [Candidatus Peregrinibacteria bacterium]
MPPILFLNGIFCPESEAKISVFDHGFLYGDGVYEAIRIYNGKILFFNEHWERLLSSLSSMRIPLPPITERENNGDEKEKYQKICETLITKNNLQNARIRITITRGENHFCFMGSESPTLLIHTAPISPLPEEQYTHGISVCTIPAMRTAPQIKHTSQISSIVGKQKAEECGVFEAILTDETGHFREGSVSNILVISRNEVWTAPKNTVLPGTMANFVLKILENNGFHAHQKNYTEDDILEKGEEVWITNSIFGILPVREINGIPQKKEFPVFKRYFGKNFWERYFV